MKKVILCFLIATAYTASAVPLNSGLSENREHSRVIEFTDDEGVVRSVDIDEEPDQDLLDEIEHDSENLYQLFTRKNPITPQTLVIYDVDSIQNSNFNPDLKTVVVAHGWLGSQNNEMNALIRDAYLAKEDVNLIVVDWRRLAVANYVTAARGIPAVGRALGEFLQFLNNRHGLDYNEVHLVGFSLGAHLVGNAGRLLNGQIARITGLDPAGPLWNINSNRLNPNDAIYVEAVHTDGDTFEGLGIGSDVGNANFYVNGGTSQPGCLTLICNHNRAYRLFAASVTYDHLTGRRCSNNIQLSLNLCRGDRLNMGNTDIRKSVTGVRKFRVNTRRSYPY
ncbi:pancreatic lipase-related protein 2-like [Trichoplusia ni]|uniref:Pancreatic lipase-related protein 2-like n=1 Tax=Trichoplusia ni TaxID=7111 RepID=A0A7E5WJW0_TRINI|nr:pancreatic lipase-related protein 2-like [Trichoplusia ni]